MENISNETVTENTETEMQQIEQEIEAEDELSADSESAPNEVQAKPTPAYEAFLEALKSHAAALGLSQKDQKGFFQFANAATGHKLYIAKQSKGVTRIDTTLPLAVLGEVAYDLEKPNGRISCHVQPTVEAVSMALDTLASYSEKIPAPKRQPKAETPAS
jgi:pantoate kinase